MRCARNRDHGDRVVPDEMGSGRHIHSQGNAERALNRTIKEAHEVVADSPLFKMNEQQAVDAHRRQDAGGDVGRRPGEVPWLPDHYAVLAVLKGAAPTRTSISYSARILKEKHGKTHDRTRPSWWIGHPGRRQ